MKIAIGMLAFAGGKGGSQRAAANLANELFARGHEVFMLCHDYGHQPPYLLAAGVRTCFVPCRLHIDGGNADLRKVRAFLAREAPDVFISMEWHYPHMLWAIACLGTGIPFICSERTDPRHMEKTWSRGGRHAVLASADFIHELSPAHMETIPEFCLDKTRVIPNAAPEFRRAATPETSNSVLFLGRFMKSKRACLLLEAFATLADKFPSWTLRFRGYGPEIKMLRKEAMKLKIAEKVSIYEPCTNIEEEYAAAGIYCLPTKIEGFPNSALEAMATGLPVVACADCPAMRPLEKMGAAILAPEATARSLADALSFLMSDGARRKQIGHKGKLLCETSYSHKNVYDAWESLLGDAAQLKGETIMDSFGNEPFASMATLSSAARREWLYRDFGEAMPGTCAWIKSRFANFLDNVFRKVGNGQLF